MSVTVTKATKTKESEKNEMEAANVTEGVTVSMTVTKATKIKESEKNEMVAANVTESVTVSVTVSKATRSAENEVGAVENLSQDWVSCTAGEHERRPSLSCLRVCPFV